jgi:hypothetical protein
MQACPELMFVAIEPVPAILTLSSAICVSSAAPKG